MSREAADGFGCHVFALAGPGRVDRAAVLRLVSGAVPEHTAYSMAEAVRWLACRVWREATTGDPDIHAHRYATEQHHIDTATTVLASGEAAWVQVTTTLFTITPHPTPDRPETPGRLAIPARPEVLDCREVPARSGARGRRGVRVPVGVGS